MQFVVFDIFGRSSREEKRNGDTLHEPVSHRFQHKATTCLGRSDVAKLLGEITWWLRYLRRHRGSFWVPFEETPHRYPSKVKFEFASSCRLSARKMIDCSPSARNLSRDLRTRSERTTREPLRDNAWKIYGNERFIRGDLSSYLGTFTLIRGSHSSRRFTTRAVDEVPIKTWRLCVCAGREKRVSKRANDHANTRPRAPIFRTW